MATSPRPDAPGRRGVCCGVGQWLAKLCGDGAPHLASRECHICCSVYSRRHPTALSRRPRKFDKERRGRDGTRGGGDARPDRAAAARKRSKRGGRRGQARGSRSPGYSGRRQPGQWGTAGCGPACAPPPPEPCRPPRPLTRASPANFSAGPFVPVCCGDSSPGPAEPTGSAPQPARQPGGPRSRLHPARGLGA